MVPAVGPGHLVLIRYGAAARPGDMVVVALPADRGGRPRPPAVKRLVRYDGSHHVWVESDNLDAPGAIDSWTVGALPATAVLARVLVRLIPPGRVQQG